MNNEPLFQSSFLGQKLKIFEDRLEYKPLWGILANINVPIKEISSVKLMELWTPGAVIETSGGQQYGLYLPFGKKKEFLKIINELKTKNP